jgi:hypothetical protein
MGTLPSLGADRFRAAIDSSFVLGFADPSVAGNGWYNPINDIDITDGFSGQQF